MELLTSRSGPSDISNKALFGRSIEINQNIFELLGLNYLGLWCGNSIRFSYGKVYPLLWRLLCFIHHVWCVGISISRTTK